MRPASQRLLDAAVLVTKSNFKMQNFLAITLKAEMAWLNHSRMNRADSYFVNFPAIHTEKFRDRRCVAIVPADWFKPRMALRLQAILFPDLAFEEMRLRMIWSKR